MTTSQFFDAPIKSEKKSSMFHDILHAHAYPCKQHVKIEAKNPLRIQTKRTQSFEILPTTRKKIKSANLQSHVHVSSKKNRTITTSTTHTRELLWAWYIGASVKEAMCPVCGVNSIHRNVDAGWDGAHIVPKSLDTHNSQSPGYQLASLMVPACRPCNTRMRSQNLIDYMYTSGRHRDMCKILWKWFSKYPFPDAVASCDNVMWRLVDSKFGPNHFSDTVNPGIQHSQPIYAQLVTYQQRKIAKQVGKLNKKILQLSDLSKRVAR